MAVDDANPFWRDRRAQIFDIDERTGRHRRFFDIDHLAGVRQEDPEVFAATHALTLRLVREGAVDGLRIDHPDGLADPAGYLERLKEVAYVWVEKILDPGERLRDWPVAGTTGYEFLNDVAALYVDPAGEAPRPLTGLERALASLPVYRTYVEPWSGRVEEDDRHAVAVAGLPQSLARVLTLEDGGWDAFVTRFQQTTPPVMAKGVEDTAFYRYLRLLALNDVGGDPSRFSLRVERFHAANRERAGRFPLNLLATQTHDTKRSGDVRARIGALASMPERWASLVRRWLATSRVLTTGGAPDSVEQYLIFQTIAAAWPIEPERLIAYMEKALREAKRNTSWITPNEQHETAVRRFIGALYEHRDFRRDFDAFAADLAEAGDRAALGQLLLKLTSPGVPDIYQGDELLSLSLVDPDNRRPVDWAARREALTEVLAGAAVPRKLFLIQRALALRARRPDAFNGSYAPIEAGPDAIAYTRGGVVVTAARLRGDGARTVSLPDGNWRDVLSDRSLSGRLTVADLTGELGIALLERT
jgi:(1->4)-alpha-D-glucan 1-alpha-D-glucosylmutase